MSKTPLGRLDSRAFGMLERPRLEARVLDGFRALGSGLALKEWIKL
jgi:hypothetical protein